MVKRVIRTPLMVAVVALWVLAALLGGTAGAAHDGGEGEGPVYSACRRIGGDIIKIHLDTEADRPCKPWQTVITWNAEGPQGPQGPQGTQGVPGEPGLDGADGAPGLDGADGVGFRVDCAITEVAQWDGTEWGCSSALADLQSQFALLLTTNPGTVSGFQSVWEDTGVLVPSQCTTPAIPEPGTFIGANDGEFNRGSCFNPDPFFQSFGYGEPGDVDNAFNPLTISVTVNLLSASGNLIDTTVVNSQGGYTFTDVEPLQDYMVEFVPPPGWQFTVGGGDMTVDPVTGRSATQTLSLGGGIFNPGVAGFVPTT